MTQEEVKTLLESMSSKSITAHDGGYIIYLTENLFMHVNERDIKLIYEMMVDVIFDEGEEKPMDKVLLRVLKGFAENQL